MDQSVNRVGKKGSLELWEPKLDLRVCSVHFESGKRYLLVLHFLRRSTSLELLFFTQRSRSRFIWRYINLDLIQILGTLIKFFYLEMHI